MSRVYEDDRKQNLYEQILETKYQCKETGATFEFWWKHIQELFSSNPLFEEIEKDVVEAYKTASLFLLMKFTTVDNPILKESLKEEYGDRLRQFKCPFLNVTGYTFRDVPEEMLIDLLLETYLYRKYGIEDLYFEDDMLEQAFVLTKACTLLQTGYTKRDFIFMLNVREFTILKEECKSDFDFKVVEARIATDKYYKLVQDEAVYTNMITTMTFEDWYSTFLKNMGYFASVSLTIEEVK